MELVEESEPEEMPILFQGWGGGELYFQKEQNWRVIKLSNILEANTRLNFWVQLGLKLRVKADTGLF